MSERWGSPGPAAGDERSAELLRLLEERGIELSVEQDELVVRGRRQALDDDLLARLRAGKQDLIAYLRQSASGAGGAASGGFFEDERSRLVDLTAEEIAAVVATVPGGAANVQDVYPLAPLQEGVLFHHLAAREGDPYLLSTACAFDSRELVDSYLAAHQKVVDRHDILRTAVVWEGVPEPVQVVWRRAELPVEEIVVDPDRDALTQLWDRADPRRVRIDVRRAPLLRILIAYDRDRGRWLMLTLLHHLVGDHTALRTVQQEIAAFVLGRGEQLAPVRPFRDFMAEVRRGPGRAEHEKFFTGLLGDVTEPTAPYGLLDTQGEGHDVAEARTLLDPETAARLRERARRLGVGVASLCHLAWAQVLARLTGRRDVVFGTVLFGRMHGAQGVAQAVGPFINTLPLRLTVDGRPVEEAATAAQGALAELLRHEHASLVLAQRCSGVPAPAPLFTSLFNYRYGMDEAPADEPSEADRPHVGSIEALRGEERTNYPLTVSVDDFGQDIAVSVQAVRPIDPERVCGYLATALDRLADALEHRPQAAADALDVLPAAERDQLLAAGATRDAHAGNDACLTDLFEAQAFRTPDAVALVHGDRRMRYAELDARANRLARRLRELGAGPDRLVALRAARGADMVVGLLAVLKSGAGYLPLDPTHPAARLDAILADSRPVALLTDDDAVPTRPPLPTVRLDDPAIDVLSADPLPRTVTGLRPEHLAYVIHTSGSTGEPKGVMVEHAQVVRLFGATAARFGFGGSDVWTLFHSIAFDFSVWELWGALLHGGRLVVVPHEVARSPQEFHDLVCREGVTVLNQTPGAFRQLLAARAADPRPHRLRHVVFGGEALDPAMLRPWFDDPANDGVQLSNMYGITETTVHVTHRPLTAADADAPGASPIGRPLADLRAYVLDERGRPAPVGVAGELYVGGAGVARGYLGRPELTGQRFLPDPYAGGDARMYRTGDLARWTADGGLDYLGRNDFQVKIRGFRIELGEVEARLRDLPQIGEAAVLAREDTPGDRRLVAYLVPADPGDPPTAEQTRTALAVDLPAHMLPAAYVVLDRLPLTRNGKLDRAALPAPDGRAYVRRGYEPPLGDVESALAEIWSELLGVERVGRHDDFFDLGGHSLLVVALLERMRRRGLHTDVRAVFTDPVLSALARTVGGASAPAEAPPNLIPPGCTRITPDMLPLVDLGQAEIDLITAQVPGGAANVQDVYPLATLQEGILFHHLMTEQEDPFLLYSLLAMRTREHVDRYTAALQAVVDRHDLLRTGFLWEGLPAPVQVVQRNAPIHVEDVELDPAGGDAARQLRERFSPANSRIDVRIAPLLQLRVAYDAAQDRWLMLMTAHHLADDYTSYRLMLGEIAAHLLGRQDELPPPLPFRTFIAASRSGLTTEQHEAFFAGMLGDVTEPTTPYGLRQVRGDGATTRAVNTLVDPQLSRRLRERARALGTTPASLFHLAYAAVLGRITGRDDVVFGTVLFGRMAGGEGADRVMGVFINTLPIRLRIGDDGAAAGVRRTYELLTELLRHEHAPLALAQRCSAVPAASPLFSALLNYRYSVRLPSMQDTATVGADDGIEMLHAQERSNYPLMLAVDDAGDDFELTAHVELPLDPERICAMMHQALTALADTLEQDPDRPLRDLDVLPAAEAATLAAWAGPSRPYPAESCVHELFEEQVRRTPAALALVTPDARLTYRELDERANRLAHHLRRLGLHADDRIAVCAERGADQVTALLAVLKAGAAYLPLDPGHPAARLADLLADSAPVAVLAEPARLPLLRDALADRGSAAHLIDLADAGRWAAEPADGPQAGARPEHLAYVIYTSGSTGEPKGVAGEHRALVNRLHWAATELPVAAGEVHAQKTSIGFVDAITETLTPLVSGAVLHTVPPQAAADAVRLAEFLHEHDAARVTVVPSLLKALLAAGAGPLPRVVVCSGEALPAALAEQALAACPDTVLVNLYGSSEVAGDVTVHRVTRGEDPAAPGGNAVAGGGADPSAPGEDDGRTPIGRPIGNARIRLLDPYGRLAPIGAPGEIHVGGLAPARGYLGRPELTGQRFTTDPYADEAVPAGGGHGTRLYRTGDLGRWREDGELEYLGREDFQVKIRGFRIELGEIEARLKELPQVRDAAVLAREDTPGDRRLVAYWVPAAAPAASVETLRGELAARLPAHMVPAAYVALDRLPSTPSGKLDRAALAEPDGRAYAGAPEYAEPAGAVERAIAGVWASVLRLDRVGREDRFLDLGGHSLLAVEVVTRLRKAGVEAAVPDLFGNVSVRRLAELAADRNPRVVERDAVPIRPGGDHRPLFLVHDGAASLLYAHTLAEYVDPRIPVHGLPPAPLGDAELTTVEGMAARMVPMIRAVQPDGPYRIAGYCTGGAIAYEIAVQLLGEDREVEFVGLLNTTYRMPQESPAGEPPDTREALLGWLPGTPEQVTELARACAGSSLPEVVAAVERAGLLPAPLVGLTPEEIGQAVRRRYLVAEAALRYFPAPLPVPVHYFSAVEHDPAHPYGRWDEALPTVDWRRIPVQRTHESMMRLPDVREVGALLSAAVGERGAAPRLRTAPPLVHTLQSGRRGVAPLVCLPGAGDTVIGLRELAGALDPGVPVHGLQPRGVDGAGLPHTTVEAAAAAFLPEVERLAGQGPVHLLGHSFGGWTAHELASRLRERGCAVASLTLLDPDIPSAEPHIAEIDDADALTELAALYEERAGRALGVTRAVLEPLGERDRRRLLHDRLREAGILPGQAGPDVLTGPIRTFTRCLRTAYAPRPVAVEPTLLVTVDDPRLDAAANAARQRETARGWRPFAPALEVWHGPGTHLTVLEPPHVAALAEQLTRRCLARGGRS